jgi:hypothetical protein
MIRVLRFIVYHCWPFVVRLEGSLRNLRSETLSITFSLGHYKRRTTSPGGLVHMHFIPSFSTKNPLYRSESRTQLLILSSRI